jgi:predicted aspartyl protease
MGIAERVLAMATVVIPRNNPLEAHIVRQYLLFILSFIAIPGLTTMAQHSADHPPIPSQASASPEESTGIQLVFPSNRQAVEVRFRLDHGKIVVPVKVNGSEPLDFVLDTGANLAFLADLRNGQNPDFEIVGEARLQGAGNGGEIPVEIAGNVTFALGGVELRGNRMALGNGGSGVLAGTGWDGIFGRQLFENLVVEVDWQSELLRLHNPQSYLLPEGASALPLAFERGHIFVQAEIVVGGGSAVPVRLVIDTGANHALSLATSEGGVQLPSRHLKNALLGRGLSGEIRGVLGRIDQIRLGNFVLEDVVTTFPDEGLVSAITSESDGNLGSEILRRFTTTFDYGRKRMILVANDHFADSFEFSTAGFRIHHSLADGRNAEVDDVYPRSPAARAGLVVGDRILAVDGRAIHQMGTEQLGRILRRSPGTKLRVKFSRGGEVYGITLVLEELL